MRLFSMTLSDMLLPAREMPFLQSKIIFLDITSCWVVAPILMPSPVPEPPQCSIAHSSILVKEDPVILTPLPLASPIQQLVIRLELPVIVIASLAPVAAVSIYRPLISTPVALILMVSEVVPVGLT